MKPGCGFLRNNRERGLEWFSALAMTAWAAVLAQAGDTLAAPNFAEFVIQGLTEDRLAAIFAAIGCGRLAVLLINGKWPRSPMARVIASAAAAILWLQIASMFAVSWWFYGVAGTGFAVYGLFALADLFNIYWAAFDVRYLRT